MRGDHKDSERTDRHSSRVASAASPVQKSPNTPPASSPPGTKLSQHAPASSPTGTKLPLFSRSRRSPGTKLSQHAQKRPFQPVLPEQGELCTALTITMPSRENFVPRPAPNPVQNSPNTHRPTSLPRISSPSTPKNGVFRLFCACWASFVAHKQPTGHAGRVFSRSMVRTDSPGGSFHWDRLLEPMSVAHGCDNGETTAGGASLRCLLRRVGAWPGSTRTIQTRPIGGCHVADRAWQQHPSAVAGPGPASRRRTKPTSKPRDGPRSDRAWQQHPSAVARPGPASRSTTPSRQARVWRSRGQATAHRCHPRAHQAARPHSRIQQHLEHQLHPEHQRPTTTTHRHRPQMPPTGASSSPAPQACATRHAPRNAPPGTRPETRPEHQRPHKHTPEATESGPEPLGSGPPSILSDYRRCAPGGTTRQVLTGARQQSAVSSARPPCHPCRSSRR